MSNNNEKKHFNVNALRTDNNELFSQKIPLLGIFFIAAHENKRQTLRIYGFKANQPPF